MPLGGHPPTSGWVPGSLGGVHLSSGDSGELRVPLLCLQDRRTAKYPWPILGGCENQEVRDRSVRDRKLRGSDVGRGSLGSLLGLGLGSSRSSSALGSGRRRLLVSAALRSGSAPAPRQPPANFPAATLGGGGEGGGGGGGSGPRGRGRDEGRRPRLSAADLQRALRTSRCNSECLSCVPSLPCSSISRALTFSSLLAHRSRP